MQENQNITDVEFKEVPDTTTDTAEQFDPLPDSLFNPFQYVTNALAAAGHAEPAAWALHIDPRVETAEEEKDRIFFANRALCLYISEQEAADNISPRMLLANGVPAAKWCALIDKGVVPWLMGQFDNKGQRVEEKVEEVLAEEGVEAEPVAATPELKVYEGVLDLSEEDKVMIKEFISAGTTPTLTIGDKTFELIYRNGASAQEWYFTAEPNVHYILSHYALAPATEEESFASTTEESDIAAKINAMAPASRTVNGISNGEGGAVILGIDSAAEGTADQTGERFCCDKPTACDQPEEKCVNRTGFAE